MKFVRTIDRLDIKHQERFVDVSAAEFVRRFKKHNKNFPCHFGQKKCFYSLFNFLVVCSEKFDLKDCLLAYVGAAPGYNISLVLDYFPDLFADLYDPKKIYVGSKSSQINIFSKKAGFVSQTTCNKLNDRCHEMNKKHLLLFWDIRTTTNDNSIALDMRTQFRLTRLVKPAAVCFKFRPIYDVFQFKYISGEIHLQVNPPVRSVESRLIAFSDFDGNFAEEVYDVDELDRVLQAYNQNMRSRLFTSEPCKILRKMNIGLTGDYENAIEIDRVTRYLFLSSDKPAINDIINMVLEINKKLCKVTGFDLSRCSQETLRKFSMKHNLANGMSHKTKN